MTDLSPTNAVSSGVSIDPMRLRSLMELRNGPGVVYLLTWAALLSGTGYALYLAQETAWIVPAIFVYGTVLTVPAYAVSHESAHGTFLKTKWLNAIVFWLTSLIYFEDPTHRFRSHMRHHNYTWINRVDTQMPFRTPLNLTRWFLEFSGLMQYVYDFNYMIMNAVGIHDTFTQSYMPEKDLPLLRRDSRLFLAFYAALLGIVTYLNAWWYFLLFFIAPRLIGGISMQFFTIIQHAEMEEDQPDLRRSCRSFDTNWVGRFLYCGMNRHIEHHLYPKVPFHALPALKKELGDQLPEPSNGAFAANVQVLGAVIKRSIFRSRSVTESSPS